LSNLAHHGRSGRLYDLTTGHLVKVKQAGLKDRVHLDDLKVYVSRERAEEEDVTGIERVQWDQLGWKGEGVERWKEIGKGGEVEWDKLMEMEVFIFG